MNKTSVIKSLQIGLVQAIDVIKHQCAKEKASGDQNDPIILSTLEQLEQLLTYSEYIHDEHPSKQHPAYGN